MIKLKLTKNKLITFINSVTQITECLRTNKKDLKDWQLIQANTHLLVLDELSRKLRSKLILIETKPGQHNLTYSINEMHALVYISHKGIYVPDPYTMAVIEDISSHIFLKLLSA